MSSNYNKKDKKRKKLKVSVILIILLGVILGCAISVIYMKVYTKKTQPDLDVRLEMQAFANTAATKGLVYVGDEYEIINYSPNTVTVRNDENFYLTAFFTNDSETKEFISSETVFKFPVGKKISNFILGGLIGFVSGIIVCVIISWIKASKKKKMRIALR